MNVEQLILFLSLLGNAGLFGWLFMVGTRVSVLEAQRQESNATFTADLKEIKEDVKGVLTKLPALQTLLDTTKLFVQQAEYKVAMGTLEQRIQRLERSDDAKSD